MRIHFIPNNVYSAVKPLCIVSKLLGLAPLGLKSMAVSPERFKGSAGLIWTVGSVFYSITILLIFVALHCVCLYQQIEYMYGTLKYTYVLTDSLNSVLTLSTVFTSVIQTITLKRNKLDIILSKINNCDKRILRNSSSDIHKKTSILLVLCMAVTTVAVIFVGMYDFFSDFGKNIIISLTYYSSHVIRIIIDIQFVTFNLLLKYRFDVLNKQLLSLFGVRSERDLEQNILDDICKGSTDYSRNIPERNDTDLQARLVTFCSGCCDLHRQLVSKDSPVTETGFFRISDSELENGLHVLRINHNEMCNTARVVFSTYGVYIVFELLNISADIITVLYFTTDFVISEGYMRIDALGWCSVWLILHAGKLIGITRTCQLVSNCGNHTSVLVSKLVLLSRPYSSNTITQLQTFCHQLLPTKLNFCACDFFELNNTTLVSVAKVSITYVIVLLLN
jgi:7tm Chemosensory receptor.